MDNREARPLQYVFGPVASRRLGLSLGVDLVPAKTCTLDCIYCESGKTTRRTLERKEWVPTADVLGELESVLADHPPLDSITFSGSGEPTLHSGLGEILSWLKDRYPEYAVTLLTNGTLFWQPELREDVLLADRIVANFDAASPEVFDRLNRPYPGLFPDRMLEGLETFREMYENELWLEVFVVPGLNDGDEELAGIAEAARRIRPDRIQINTLDRPGVVNWIEKAGPEVVEKVRRVLASAESVGDVKGDALSVDMGADDLAGRVLALVKRRPVTEADMTRTLGAPFQLVKTVLARLQEDGRIRSVDMDRGTFYRLPDSSESD